MRYLVSIVFAVIGGALAMLFVSSHVADWVVAHQTFESSDDAETMNMLVFMLSNVVGLIIGWLVGWTITGGRSAGNQPS
jgi:uncharacterized membrane protein YeaQ/YmgE (transglycosylase-associated protein family)